MDRAGTCVAFGSFVQGWTACTTRNAVADNIAVVAHDTDAALDAAGSITGPERYLAINVARDLRIAFLRLTECRAFETAKARVLCDLSATMLPPVVAARPRTCAPTSPLSHITMQRAIATITHARLTTAPRLTRAASMRGANVDKSSPILHAWSTRAVASRPLCPCAPYTVLRAFCGLPSARPRLTKRCVAVGLRCAEQSALPGLFRILTT